MATKTQRIEMRADEDQEQLDALVASLDTPDPAPLLRAAAARAATGSA